MSNRESDTPAARQAGPAAGRPAVTWKRSAGRPPVGGSRIACEDATPGPEERGSVSWFRQRATTKH